MARKGFVVLEKLMKDGRKWVLNSDEPTLADIEGEYVLDCKTCC